MDFSHNNLSDASLGPLMECFERLQLQMCDVTSCGFSDGGIALLTQNLHKPGEAPSLQAREDTPSARACGPGAAGPLSPSLVQKLLMHTIALDKRLKNRSRNRRRFW